MLKKCAEPISGHETERLHAHLHGQLRPNSHVQQHIRAHSFQVRSTKVLNVVFSINKFLYFCAALLQRFGATWWYGPCWEFSLPQASWCLRALWWPLFRWLFFCIFLGVLECACHSFAYVAHFVFFYFERCLESNTKNWRSKGARPT
jgi:hypothetical protein